MSMRLRINSVESNSGLQVLVKGKPSSRTPVGEYMHRWKHGIPLKNTGKPPVSREQAIAIGLSKERRGEVVHAGRKPGKRSKKKSVEDIDSQEIEKALVSFTTAGTSLVSPFVGSPYYKPALKILSELYKLNAEYDKVLMDMLSKPDALPLGVLSSSRISAKKQKSEKKLDELMRKQRKLMIRLNELKSKLYDWLSKQKSVKKGSISTEDLLRPGTFDLFEKTDYYDQAMRIVSKIFRVESRLAKLDSKSKDNEQYMKLMRQHKKLTSRLYALFAKVYASKIRGAKGKDVQGENSQQDLGKSLQIYGPMGLRIKFGR